jgi:hypothetical protein
MVSKGSKRTFAALSNSHCSGPQNNVLAEKFLHDARKSAMRTQQCSAILTFECL